GDFHKTMVGRLEKLRNRATIGMGTNIVRNNVVSIQEMLSIEPQLQQQSGKSRAMPPGRPSIETWSVNWKNIGYLNFHNDGACHPCSASHAMSSAG
ncbi:MAG TPA: hypothetical protein PKA58_12725, partial [Polyangium sp.]|nr:hypothetical protein [Polyangium sp.]